MVMAALSSGHGDHDSVLARLRARREALAGEHHLDLDVPGYGGELVARYAPLRAGGLTRLFPLISPDAPAPSISVVADELIAACRAVLIRDDGKLGDIAPEYGSLGFEQRLAAVFGFEAETAREVVVGVFGPDPHIEGHGMALVSWSTDASTSLDARVEGES